MPLYDHFRCAQAEEAWATLGSWVAATRAQLRARGEGALRRRPHHGSGQGRRRPAFRRGFQARMRALLAGGAVLAYPTCPVPAPRLTAPPRTRMRCASAPWASPRSPAWPGCARSRCRRPGWGAPVGLSLVAAPGRDRALLALAARLAEALGLRSEAGGMRTGPILFAELDGRYSFGPQARTVRGRVNAHP